MKLKALIVFLLLALVVWWGLDFLAARRPKPLAQTPSTTAAGTNDVQAKPNPIPPATAATNAGTTNTPAAPDPEHAKYVRQTIARLQTLQMNNDQDSLNAILAEMKNPDKAIRAAALEATIQFSDRSVIPKLQDIAAQTEDPYEKVQILKAIDYIKLPSLTEYMAQKRALKSTRNRTNPPSLSPSATNNPQPAPGQP